MKQKNLSSVATPPRPELTVRPDNYWRAVGRLVMMRAAGYLNRLDMSTREYEFLTATWTETLRPVIPLDQLMDAYFRAVRDHEGQYTVTISEVIQAHRKLERERRGEIIPPPSILAKPTVSRDVPE